MPIIQVKYATLRKSVLAKLGLKDEIASAVTAHTTRILRKDPKLISIALEEVPAADWYVGGATLADQAMASFFLDIKVTEDTNTKDEKAAFMAAIFRAMGDLLGPLHHESYVLVHDARADSYGYGGLTQEQRRITAVQPVKTAA